MKETYCNKYAKALPLETKVEDLALHTNISHVQSANIDRIGIYTCMRLQKNLILMLAEIKKIELKHNSISISTNLIQNYETEKIRYNWEQRYNKTMKWKKLDNTCQRG